MRIASYLRTLVAVVSLAAFAMPHSASQNNRTLTRHSASHREQAYDAEDADQFVYYGGESRRMTHREMQLLLRQEGGERGLPVDCCPSVPEMVEPEGGRNQDGEYVELYRNGDIRQRFYEKSCRKDVVGKPCRFVDRRLHNQSQCVQQFSYSYAIVRDRYEATTRSGDPQRHHHHHHHQPRELTSSLDYIRIRSGCSCEVVPKAKKKRADNKGKRGKSKKFDEDET